MRSGDAPQPPAQDLSPYTEAQVRFAVAAWPMRAAQELRSALIFRALAAAARATATPGPWPAHFDSATRDEIRHARLCVAAGARLGARPPVWDPRPVRTRLGRLPGALERVTRLLLVEVAIGETISTHLFRAGRRATAEPFTRWALQSILADEVRHQRLGWEGLGAIWPGLAPAQRDSMQREAATGLGAIERDVALPAMRWLESGRSFDPAYAALGVLHPEARVEAFYTAIERHVVPRLTRLGLDGKWAWENRYRVAARD
jgi:hypothetical protein